MGSHSSIEPAYKYNYDYLSNQLLVITNCYCDRLFSNNGHFSRKNFSRGEVLFLFQTVMPPLPAKLHTCR